MSHKGMKFIDGLWRYLRKRLHAPACVEPEFTFPTITTTYIINDEEWTTATPLNNLADVAALGNVLSAGLPAEESLGVFTVVGNEIKVTDATGNNIYNSLAATWSGGSAVFQFHKC